MPEQETKSEKFMRLSVIRINKFISACEGLSKLASVNYESTDEQVERIEEVATNALSTCIEKLQNKKVVEKGFVW